LSITTPVVNYYEHATYLTVNHGHTALFGTYGILAMGLLLFSMRTIVKPSGWDERFLKVSFWGVNIGLFIMFAGTLLPVGILQVLDNIKYGFWHARSDAFWSKDVIQIIGQTRMIPDLFIIIGAASLLLFMVKAMRHLKPVTMQPNQQFPTD
ncbi:MAG: cbb3-type cytochrome c oxidase subunit I, partial [Desulfarculaceae bacterium]|nr:cbb3-type cytochrome c oxidase subunit I [Desulfarculaceae bacterium]